MTILFKFSLEALKEGWRKFSNDENFNKKFLEYLYGRGVILIKTLERFFQNMDKGWGILNEEEIHTELQVCFSFILLYSKINKDHWKILENEFK